MALSLSRKRNTKPKNPAVKGKGEFVLFIGDEGAILSYIENGEVTRRLYSPSPKDKSTETFNALLSEYSNCPIHFLVDMVDQSYVRHTLPPVTPLGVNKIIQRRLDRDFSAEDIKGSISLGREKTGRKDWNFLLISLSYNDTLRSWCEFVYDLPNRFTGIYLAPVESELLVHKLEKAMNPEVKKDKTKGQNPFKKSKADKDAPPPPSCWNILVTHNKTGGFRQVVLKAGKLVFTRMAQSVDDANHTVTAGNVEQEVKNTIEYLKRLSFNNSSTLNITIVVGEDIKKHISADSFLDSNTTIITPHEASLLLKVEKSVLSGDRYADIMLSCAFAQSKKKKLRLSTTYIKKTETMYKSLFGLKVATALGILGLISMTALSGYEMLNLSSEAADIRSKSISTGTRLETFKEKAATFKEDPFKVDSLIKIHDIISETAPYYFESVKQLAPFISESFVVRSLNWESGNIKASDSNNRGKRQGNRNFSNMSDTKDDATKTNITIDFEVTAADSNRERFITQLDNKLDALQGAFSNFSVERGTIPGIESNSDELKVNFEARNKSAVEIGQKVKIEVKISGPLDDEDTKQVAP